jgi:SPP1 family phage portal protein
MADQVKISGSGSIIKGDRFVFPKDGEITSDDLQAFIKAHKTLSETYDKYYQYYLGNQEILDETRKVSRPDNRIVVNMAKYVVETFNGYFMGIAPKISLEDDSLNDQLQNWMNQNSFQDKLNEVSKQVDIYGRSYLFAYQNEQSQTGIAVADPTSSFMIFDDTVAHDPLAFVRYSYDDDNKLSGVLYTANQIINFDDNFNLTADAGVNIFQHVPAAEFYANEERLSIIANIKTLVDSLNKGISQKANQVEYFDNAYLKILGIQLEKDPKTGEPILNLDGNQIIYSPDQNAVKGVVDFIQKPDGDNMQEHYLDRLINFIYQISMVANLQDEAFSGNASGVAIQYKLLPMQNLAATKERKFTQSLRQMFSAILPLKTVVKTNDIDSLIQDLRFKFTRNMPINLADEATTAQTLTGITSKETQLSVLSIVDDPKTEIQRMQDEQADTIKNAVKTNAAATDTQKAGVEDDNTTAKE